MRVSKAAWFLIGATLGAGAGVGGTYIYMKDKFEKRLNEEVNALKTHYVERDRELAKKNEEKKKELEEIVFSKNETNDFMDYANIYKSNTPEKVIAAVSHKEVVNDNLDISGAAEIISDVDFADPNFDNYQKISVDYFEDGAAFESLSGEEIDGFELIVGDDFKTAFGEFTPNVVYVRNDELQVDYEIIEQEGSHPHPEDE